jgi:hypothetical protein
MSRMLDAGSRGVEVPAWFATLDEIARPVRAGRDAGTYEPAVVSLPSYDSPPAAFAESGP